MPIATFLYANSSGETSTKYRKQFRFFPIVTQKAIVRLSDCLTCFYFIPSKQQLFNIKFMGFNRYLTNNHHHSDIAFYSKQKSFEQKKKTQFQTKEL